MRARTDVFLPRRWVNYAACLLLKSLCSNLLLNLTQAVSFKAASGRTFVHYLPYGVVVSIVPWNAPVTLAFLHLLAGNDVVVNHQKRVLCVPKRDSAISVVKPIEKLPGNDGAKALHRPMDWSVLAQKSMSSRSIVVLQVRLRHPTQVFRAQGDDMVGALAPDQKRRGAASVVRCRHRATVRVDDLPAFTRRPPADHDCQFLTIRDRNAVGLSRIPIARTRALNAAPKAGRCPNEILRSRIPREGLRDLPRQPFGCEAKPKDRRVYSGNDS